MKPKKKEMTEGSPLTHIEHFKEGYNQAIDDYDKHLPSEDEILTMISDFMTPSKEDKYISTLAKAIHKRYSQ